MNNLDAKIKSLAKSEKLAIPAGYDAMLKNTYAALPERTSQIKHGISKRRLTAVLIAATLLLVGTASALAFSGVGEWFLDFFRGQSGKDLTPGQQHLIEGSAADIGESVTSGGLTITVESVLCDDYTIYVKLNVEAPEGVVLDADNYTFEKDVFLGNPNWKLKNYSKYLNGYSGSCTVLEDNDGKSNTVSLLFQRTITMAPGSNFSFRDGKARWFELKNFQTSEDVGDGGNKAVTLFEGIWRFEFVYGDGTNSVELISAPVYSRGWRWSLHEDGVDPVDDPYEDVLITSFVLSPLGATCFYEFWDDGGKPEALNFYGVELVMRDGSVVGLFPSDAAAGTMPGGGTSGYFKFKVDMSGTIVVLDEVDYVRFPGDVVLPMG